MTIRNQEKHQTNQYGLAAVVKVEQEVVAAGGKGIDTIEGTYYNFPHGGTMKPGSLCTAARSIEPDGSRTLVKSVDHADTR